MRRNGASAFAKEQVLVSLSTFKFHQNGYNIISDFHRTGSARSMLDVGMFILPGIPSPKKQPQNCCQ
jgi:hypothetical protein